MGTLSEAALKSSYKEALVGPGKSTARSSSCRILPANHVTVVLDVRGATVEM